VAAHDHSRSTTTLHNAAVIDSHSAHTAVVVAEPEGSPVADAAAVGSVVDAVPFAVIDAAEWNLRSGSTPPTMEGGSTPPTMEGEVSSFAFWAPQWADHWDISGLSQSAKTDTYPNTTSSRPRG